jgi:hypothetical protein
MLHEYHVIYSVRYYPRFHIPAVGLGTYYSWIRGHYCIYVIIVVEMLAFEKMRCRSTLTLYLRQVLEV